MKKNIIILVVFTLVLLILFVSAPIISLYNFENIEQQEIKRDAKQSLNIINEKIRQVNTIADDYAGWDDACEFVQGTNPLFVEKNIGEDFYNKLNINIFMILDGKGAVVYQHAYDYHKKIAVPLPLSLREHIAPGTPLVTSFRSGLLALPEGLLIVVSRPILTSKYQGPAKGSMIFGCFLDSREIDRLAKMIQLRMKLIDSAGMDAKLRNMLKSFPTSDAINCRTEGEEMIAAYAPLKDIYGENAGILKVENTRQIYLQAKDYNKRFIILYSATAALFVVLLILIGQKLVVIRRQDLESREALLAKQLELEVLNNTLEKRVAKEVNHNRERDRIMIHQGRLAAMGEMIGNIAHQWRQPLNQIGLVVQKIEFDYDLRELTEESLKSMVSECMKYILYMSRTIDDFRNFFSSEKEKTSFSLNDAIKRGLSLISASVTSNHIRLNFQEDGISTVIGHTNQFTQAVLNLVNNSMDALLANNPAEPFIEIHCFCLGPKSIVTVRDNGGGIDESIINKVFDPYFTTKYKSLGTGIGLYMAKMIIENTMGGSLSVRNIDDGAEFRIEINSIRNNELATGTESNPSSPE